MHNSLVIFSSIQSREQSAAALVHLIEINKSLLATLYIVASMPRAIAQKRKIHTLPDTSAEYTRASQLNRRIAEKSRAIKKRSRVEKQLQPLQRSKVSRRVTMHTLIDLELCNEPMSDDTREVYIARDNPRSVRIREGI